MNVLKKWVNEALTYSRLCKRFRVRTKSGSVLKQTCLARMFSQRGIFYRKEVIANT